MPSHRKVDWQKVVQVRRHCSILQNIGSDLRLRQSCKIVNIRLARHENSQNFKIFITKQIFKSYRSLDLCQISIQHWQFVLILQIQNRPFTTIKSRAE